MKRKFPSLIVSLLITFGLGLPAQAVVIGIDNFQVFKNGATYMNDTFDVPGPLALADFIFGNQASYSLTSSVAQSEPAGSMKRVLNTTLAPVQASTFVPGTFFQQTAAELRSNTQPLSTSTRGLKSDDDIKIVGIFDLFTPEPNGLYEIRLRDSSGGNPADDQVRLRVQTLGNGVTRVALTHLDGATGAFTTIASLPFNPDIDDDQIMLILDNSLDGIHFEGSFVFLDGGSPGAVMELDIDPTGKTATEITELMSLQTLFHGEDWTRAGFRAINTRVPEPDTFAILALGLAGLGVTRRRKRAAGCDRP